MTPILYAFLAALFYAINTPLSKLMLGIKYGTAANASLLGNFQFSYGSLFVLFATACWELENNCTRSISDKSTYEIVVLKGIFSGGEHL